ncbi:MAG: ribbon-helix-helix protein, CopG family [Bryobacterales bacterium]|nr:ribbon-helix-helix protein, CopG family [Bryobacterales bacterium]
MASVKVTFTLDEATVRRLSDAAERLAKSKSEVVREAIEDYHTRIGRLSERERIRMLRLFDELVPQLSSRPAGEVRKELRELRRARRSGGRRLPQ